MRETVAGLGGPEASEAGWRKFLHDGFLANSAAQPVEVSLNETAVAEALEPPRELERAPLVANNRSFGWLSNRVVLRREGWLALATVYLLTMTLEHQGALREVLHEQHYYFLGSMLFAYTVFYAYIHFAQYFIIWNGNMPDETFWYVLREKGGWWNVGMVIILGHFFLPFLALLRIDVKYTFSLMIPLCLWCWLMHWVDLAFNIMPALHEDGLAWRWLWLDAGCLAFMDGLLRTVFLKAYAAHAPCPVKDPRLLEALGLYPALAGQIPAGQLDHGDDLRDAPPQFGGLDK